MYNLINNKYPKKIIIKKQKKTDMFDQNISLLITYK